MAQKAGDLSVVIVGWNDTTAAVTPVTDTKKNVYQSAVGPTQLSGFLSQSIYYAKNIGAAGAGANAVTVTFNTAAAYPDIRILEYSGIDTLNAVDVAAGAAGNSATSDSGSVTTANALDLLVAGNMVWTWTSGPGANFTRDSSPARTATSHRTGWSRQRALIAPPRPLGVRARGSCKRWASVRPEVRPLANTNCDANTNGHANTNCDANTNCHTNTDCDANTNGLTNANCDSSSHT